MELIRRQRKKIEKMILEIEKSSPQTIRNSSEYKAVKLGAHPALISDLSGWIGALIVRTILHELNIDEHFLFKWRPENKYIQYLILSYYIPGCMPETMSLSDVLNETDSILKIREFLKDGFFLKSALGHGSGTARNFDRTEELDDVLDISQKNYDQYEKWILQRKLKIDWEFRVHTFGKDVVHGLTFKITGTDLPDNASTEDFVKGILKKLPEALLNGTLIGWDIGLTDTDQYYVIEANFTGFHPEYARGFQTSGYVEDNAFGPVVCALLNNYLKDKYKIYINAVDRNLLQIYPFLREFMFYVDALDKENCMISTARIQEKPVYIILYPNDDINSLIKRLMGYFQVVKFAYLYYVIVKEEYKIFWKNLYPGDEHVRILVENDLFTHGQFELVKQLSVKRRKRICFYHAQRIIN